MTADAETLGGSLGLVSRRVKRAEITHVLRVGVLGLRGAAVFERGNGTFAPVYFQLTRRFHRALVQAGWPVDSPIADAPSYLFVYERMKAEATGTSLPVTQFCRR